MYISIFGTGRNGSSLLLRLIDGIQDTYVHQIDESFLSLNNDYLNGNNKVSIKTLHHNHDQIHNDNKKFKLNKFYLNFYKDKIKYIKENFTDYLEKKENFKKEVLIDKYFMREFEIKDFIEEYFDSMSSWLQNKVSKNTFFKSHEVEFLPMYEKIFPNMKFIHIIRNPVDVYASTIRKSREVENFQNRTNWYLAGDTLLHVIKKWKMHTDFIKSKINHNNHLVVKYEDLVNNPIQETKNICDWVGLPLPLSLGQQTIFMNKKINYLPENVGMHGVETPLEVENNMAKKFQYITAVYKDENILLNFILYENFNYFYKAMTMPKISNLKLLLIWILPKSFEFQRVSSFKRLLHTIYRMIIRRIKILKALV